MALTKAEIREIANEIAKSPEQKAITKQWCDELDREYDKDFGNTKKQ